MPLKFFIDPLLVFCAFTMSASSSVVGNITFYPTEITDFYEGEESVISFNLTTTATQHSISALADNEIIISVVSNASQELEADGNGLFYGIIGIRGQRLGRSNVGFYLHATSAAPTSADRIGEVQVVVLRRRRTVDDVFRYGIIALAAILYIGFGCKINLALIWKIAKRPMSPAIGFASQFVIMPVLGFALGQIFSLEDALSFGLLTLACSPGGGSSNVWVNLFDGNLDLSLTMTTISTFAALGMMPFWLYALGHFYLDSSKISIPFVDIVRSLLTIIIPCGMGLIIRHFAPKAADMIAYFTRPFSGIFVLYILTFGTYVNFYMYEIMGDDPAVIPAAILLPVFGYLCGFGLAMLTRRDKSTAVTISIETGVQNASIPIIVLQGSFPQPEGDVAAVMPVAASLFYTIPIIIAWIIYLVYKRYHPNDLDDLGVNDVTSYDLQQKVNNQNDTKEEPKSNTDNPMPVVVSYDGDKALPSGNEEKGNENV